MTISSPLFKGATRPPCVFGVPIRPFVAASGGAFLLGLWTWPPAALSAVPIILLMRAVTKEDDQKFRALGIRFRYRGLASGPALWAAASPRILPMRR